MKKTETMRLKVTILKFQDHSDKISQKKFKL